LAGYFLAGFSREIGYYNNDKLVLKIDRVRDSIHNGLKLFGLPVPRVPSPGAAVAGVGKGLQGVMPRWP
jgi:hypothetical protein